jgi:hypothetical protein
MHQPCGLIFARPARTFPQETAQHNHRTNHDFSPPKEDFAWLARQVQFGLDH